MTNMHQFSPCCGIAAHRHGDRRYRCPRCGRTWSRYPHKRGRKRYRGQQELVKRVVFAGEQLTHQQKHYPSLSYSAVVHRFTRELTRLLARPPVYPTGNGRYLLLVDALWFRFGEEQWTLYLMALKPQGQNVAILLEPVMLCGKEAARDWRVAIQTIPHRLQARIDGFISDDLAGLRGVADEYGWIHQLCQFHLIKEVYRRLGRRRPNHTPQRDLRERIYAHLRVFLREDDGTAASAAAALHHIAQDPRCPTKLRQLVRTALRQEHRYRAYRQHPHLTLPITTGMMESLGAQIRRRTQKLNSPAAVERWARAYVRYKKQMRCNGYIPQK